MPTPNTFTWTEIPSPDLEQSARFYRAVFGWTTEPFGDDYIIAKLGDTMVCGLYRWAKAAPDGVRVYVSVDDLEAVLAAVVASGGAVERPRSEIGPGMGWWADIRDPAGTLIGITSDRPEA